MNKNQIGSSKPDNAPSLTLRDDPAAIEVLSDMLAQCYDGLKVYGKTPAQLTNTIKLFALALADQQIDDVQAAFLAYLKNHPEMPAPSDILGYIRRGNRPPLDRALYVALCQKRQQTAWHHGPETWQQGHGLTGPEEKYINDFENLQINETAP